MDADVALRIAHDHPALAGHFPGDPIVPGALLLDEAAAAVQDYLGTRIRDVLLAKFPAAMRPDVACAMRISERMDVLLRRDPRAAVYAFSVGSADEPLASGRAGVVMTSPASTITS